MGAELCLAHDMGGGVEAYGGPLSVDMQPYGCFIKKKKSSQLETSEGIRERIGFNPFQMTLTPASADRAGQSKSVQPPAVDEELRQKMAEHATRMRNILFDTTKPSCVVASRGLNGDFPLQDVYSCIVKLLTAPHSLQVGMIRDCGIWDEHFMKVLKNLWKSIHKIAGAFQPDKDMQLTPVPMLTYTSASERVSTTSHSSGTTSTQGGATATGVEGVDGEGFEKPQQQRLNETHRAAKAEKAAAYYSKNSNRRSEENPYKMRTLEQTPPINNRKPPSATGRGSTKPIRGGHPPCGSSHSSELKGDGSGQAECKKSVRGRSRGGGVFPQGPPQSQYKPDDYYES